MDAFWHGKVVVVTGATGFVGGWAAKTLLAQGAEVVALVRDRVARTMLMQEGLLEKMTVVAGDVESFPLLCRLIAEYEPHTVFHFAAQSLVGTAQRCPLNTFRTNIMGTWNLLEACRCQTKSSLVLASSDKAYGPSKCLPYRESYPLHGTHPYDVSKTCADLIAQMYAHDYGVRLAIVRCANIFGGGDTNLSRLIPGVICDALLGKRLKLRSDGTAIRDLLYVKDAADAYLRVGQLLAEHDSLAGEAFNFSYELHLTVREIVSLALEIMGRSDLEPEAKGSGNGEIAQQYLDATKAREMLGWTPQYSLREALEETIDWYSRWLNVDAHGAAKNTSFDSA
jgi:CDP-glucose 4,6-dehydratase